MRRTRVIACIISLIVILSANFAFAGEPLKIVDNYPENGQKNTTVENMCVKLEFNNDVYKNPDESSFAIKDNKGKKLPIRILSEKKSPKEILVLVDMTKNVKIKDNSEYKLVVSKNFEDNDGNKLGENAEISFKTLNQAWNTKVYMIMMFVMMAGMFIFTSRAAKKAKEEQQTVEEVINKDAPFNPYKEARRTGKSIEEVNAEHEREMEKLKIKEEKLERKARKKKAKEEAILQEILEEEEANRIEVKRNFSVKERMPISRAGGKYKHRK